MNLLKTLQVQWPNKYLIQQLIEVNHHFQLSSWLCKIKAIKWKILSTWKSRQCNSPTSVLAMHNILSEWGCEAKFYSARMSVSIIKVYLQRNKRIHFIKFDSFYRATVSTSTASRKFLTRSVVHPSIFIIFHWMFMPFRCLFTWKSSERFEKKTLKYQ